jgi:hypothetical protein
MKTKPTLFVSVLATALFLGGCASPPKTSPPLIKIEPAFVKEGLVAYYPFNGDAADASGNGNDGNVEGPTLATDRNGADGRAYNFDGDDDYIDIGDQLPDAKAVTVSAWIYKRDDKPAFVFSDSTSANGNDFMLAVSKNGIGIRADKSGGSLLSGAIPHNGYKDVGEALTEDRWLMLTWAMSPDKSNLYIDGKLVVTVDAAGSNIGHHGGRIGADAHFPTAYVFHGSIDDVRIYNRALSAEEVKALYDLEKPKGK